VTGTPVAGATNLQLMLTNVDLPQAGFYYAVAGNCHMQTTSAVVLLTVLSQEAIQAYAFTNFAGLRQSPEPTTAPAPMPCFSIPTAWPWTLRARCT